MSTNKTFSWKAFVSFYIVFSFVVLGVSGIVLYVAPPGRVANWSVWTLVALSKAQWQAVHTIFSFVFLVAASFHLYFNWKVLVAYVKSKLHEGIRMKRELGSASAVGVALLTLTIAGVPPFSTVMDVGDDIKNAWTVPTNEPPLPHAEELTVEKLAETVKMPARQGAGEPRGPGRQVEGTGRDGAADRRRQRPDATAGLPEDAERRRETAGVDGRGGGWGRKTVDDICRQYAVPVDTGVARLTAAGFDAAGSDAPEGPRTEGRQDARRHREDHRRAATRPSPRRQRTSRAVEVVARAPVGTPRGSRRSAGLRLRGARGRRSGATMSARP